MDFQSQHIAMDRRTDAQHIVNGTGTVLPVPFSQERSTVGVHWLRISFSTKYLSEIAQFLSHIWGDHSQDGFGLWSYDSRLIWSSGVSLNYDEDVDRSERVHAGQMTLDCPGSALDEMTAPDLQLLIKFADQMGGKCTRIDVFFDDYARIVNPVDLLDLIKCGDYSGLRHAQDRQKYDMAKLIRDEVSFGERGSRGNGKYLRFYDKEIESKGEQNCCRWEVEFSQRKADTVFKKLAQTMGDMDCFASMCGSLIAGCVTFVHRNGDKNVSRLKRYHWWEQILSILGEPLKIRAERKVDNLTGKIQWVTRNVSPSLACLRRVFVSDKAFFRWLFDVCHDGESRMNPFTEQIAREHEQSLDYRWGEFHEDEEVVYDKAVSQL
jgi:hypothetical protein